MSGSDEDRTISDWNTKSRFYRRKPGVGWLVAFLAIPLLLALIGWGGWDRAGNSDELVLPSINSSATLSATAGAPSSAAPVGKYGPLSIMRNGNTFTLSGELPDADTKNGLLDTLKLVLPGATLGDELTVNPGIQGPDAGALGGIFSTAVGIPDFSLKFDGTTVTLTGTAPDEPIKASAEEYAKAAWPNATVVNDIEVKGSASATPRASLPPAAPPTPGPAAGGPCATLQTDITDLLKTPINYATNGSTLASTSQQLVRRIADKLKACPNVKVAVVGYTDNTGNDAINGPLSGGRAKAVADALVAAGVPGNTVSSRGAGAANPIASNDTTEGRAQNRRVEITVS